MMLVTRYLLRRLLASLEGIRHGRLRLTLPDGSVHRFGDEGDEVTLDIRDWSVLPAIASRGDVGLGETWIDGLWETSSLEGLLTLALRNIDQLEAWSEPHGLARLRMVLIDRLFRLNSLRGSSRNIRAHYDVGNEFYQLWLDQIHQP